MMLNILISGFVPGTDKFSYKEKGKCVTRLIKCNIHVSIYHISYFEFTLVRGNLQQLFPVHPVLG